MTRVLHYVQEWLPLSAQFVHGAVARSRHDTLVVSREAPVNAATFPVDRLTSVPRLALALAPRLGSGAVTAALGARDLRFRAEVVHVHFGYAVHDVVGFHRRRDVPLTLALHGHDVTALGREQPDHYRSIADHLAAVVVPSRFLAERATDVGIPAGVVHVVPAGVDRDRFAPRPRPEGGPPTAVFVGRFVPKKGLDVLLDAWSRVRAAVPDARLRVLGEGPLADLVDGAAGAGVERLRPDPSRRAVQVADLIGSGDVVVTPSRTAADGDAESLLLVNLEAQASGRAVVTTDHGGIPEFVDDGRSALVVPEADPDALADALVAVLADPDLARRLGAAGVEVAARFDVDACTARLDDVLASVAGG